MDQRPVLFRYYDLPEPKDNPAGYYSAHDSADDADSQDPILLVRRCDDEILRKLPIGASRLGGVPDLPEGFEWPRWQGYFLPLLAQINLTELDAGDDLLPAGGWLYVFALSGSDSPNVPSVSFHLDCDVDELQRQPRPPHDEVWVSGEQHMIELPLARTIAITPAGSANLDDKQTCAWLLATEVTGYGDAAAVAAEAGLQDGDWTFLLSMKRSIHRQWTNSDEFHLLIRESDLRARRFGELQPFVVVAE